MNSWTIGKRLAFGFGAERLRQRAPGVKVLLISGYSEHPLLDAAHAAGEPCLVKPFELSTFSDTVPQLLAACPRRLKPPLYFPRRNDEEDAGSLSIFS
jgi:hypothetical protein